MKSVSKKTTRELRESAKFIADLMGVDLDTLVDEIIHDGGSPRKKLLLAIIDDCKQSRSRLWWESHTSGDTKSLVERCFKFTRSAFLNTSDEDQFNVIRDALEVLGRSDVHKYPPIKQKPAEQINLAVLSEGLNNSDAWLANLDRLLSKTYQDNLLLDNKTRLGILIVWLVLGQGICSKAELSICLREIRHGRIRNHQSLFWTSGCYEKRRGERRRQWLSEDIVLLVGSINWNDPQCDISTNSHAIRDALASLKRQCPLLKSFNQASLYRAGQGRAYFIGRLPVFAIEYSRGIISSSSLPEERLAALLEQGPSPIDVMVDDLDQGTPKLMDSKRFDPAEELASGEMLADVPIKDASVMTQRSKILSRSDKSDAKRDALLLISTALSSETPPLIEQILSWAQDYLKHAAPRTVKLGLDHLHARLIPAVEDLQIIDDPEYWASLLEEITANLDERSKAISALSSFAGFLTREHCEEFATAGQTSYSGINAQCVSSTEVESALTLLKRELPPDLYDVAHAIVSLAYGAGLRRSEVDGLLVSDFELGTTPVVKIRQHKHRALKTTNAKRYIPLHLVEAFFPGHFGLITSLDQSATSPLIFQQHGHQPLSITDRLFNRITQALQDATGNKKVKFHSLRHTFCCNLLLGLFCDHFQLGKLKHYIPYISDVEKLRRVLPGILGDSGTSDRFELSAVRSMLGHLQESTSLLHYFHFMDVFRFAGMNQPESQIVISPTARHGAAGFSQNSRAIGSKIRDGQIVFDKIIESHTHSLTPRPESKVSQHIDTFKASSQIRQTLDEVFAMCRKVLNKELISAHPISGWGIASQESIQGGIDQIQKVFLTGALAKDVQAIFERVSDKGAIDCYQAMLGNLSKLDQDELNYVASDLVWLSKQRVTPYVTYRFENRDDAQRAVDLLHLILLGYNLRQNLTGKVRVGKKRVMGFVENMEQGQMIPSLECHHYLLKIYRGEEQFPHRALSHLTAGLMLCLACVQA